MSAIKSVPRVPAITAAAVVVVAVLFFADAASAQENSVRWVVDEETSLAWWQIDPHLDHLWATTCPDDPSWQPGGGFSSAFGSMVDRDELPEDYEGHANVSSSHIPLYPREEVNPVCAPAVEGTVAVEDTTAWEGVTAKIVMDSEKLVTGDDRRDNFLDDILEIYKYPTIEFTVDSLTDVEPGDTLQAKAVGTLDLHGVETPMEADVKAWDYEDGMRVKGSFSFPAGDLTKKYDMSKWKLGLGVWSNIWKTVHMGVDVVLHPEEAEAAGGEASASAEP